MQTISHFISMRPELLFPFFADIISLSGVGPRVRDYLERAMGDRVKDLLFTPPKSIIDRSYRPSISDAKKGDICTFKVTIGRHSPPRHRNRPYRIKVYDDTGEMGLTFFKHKADYLTRLLPEGSMRIISGKVDVFNADLQMSHPDYVVAPENIDTLPLYETQYPLTAGLSQKVARKAVMQALTTVPELPEWLDFPMVNDQNWPDFRSALKQLHDPQHPVDAKISSPARLRLAYDELLAKQLAMALVRQNSRQSAGRAFDNDRELIEEVIKAAPFSPTSAQLQTLDKILADLKSPFRMTRLLQGDVGSGKTFVATLAAAYVASCDVQIALMAPTEILARQHAETMKGFLEPVGLTVEALTGRDKGQARMALKKGLSEGYIDVVIGTHALFQDDIEFKELGLVIVDEQHRFGVKDRLRLTEKGRHPDLLVMTATPIPRTLALTSYGDLDVSKITEKPVGRQPIQTRILPLKRLDDVIDAIGRALSHDQQIYWVCPLVEESELIDLSSVEDRFKQLSALYGDRVGLLHGRMKALDKQNISKRFQCGEIDILVATTVIEVGVDAPNATIMVIEHAERFGLAQLHQLRGRVGRSDKPSTCLLLFQGPLSANGKARLETIRSTEDGFLIAEKDWELRGTGDLLGSRQSGLPHYQLADLDVHKSLLETAQQDARYLVQTDPKLQSSRGQAARTLLYLFEQDYGISLMNAG